MKGTASLSFDQATEQIEGMAHQGTEFARVEAAIDAAGFSHSYKAALWLLAWSLRDPALQHRDARLMAGSFAAGGQDQPAEQSPRLGVAAQQLRSAVTARRDRDHARRDDDHAGRQWERPDRRSRGA